MRWPLIGGWHIASDARNTSGASRRWREDRDDESQAAKDPDPMRSEKGMLREYRLTADAISGCETRIVSPNQCSAQ